MKADTQHLLTQLTLPSRYENLSAEVGPDVASLLVEPSEDTLTIFRRAAKRIRVRRRGIFLPVYALPGTGKTTLLSNVRAWLPSEYGPTITLKGGVVTSDRLQDAVETLVREHDVPANDDHIYVINLDDRESDPPTDKELSQIKSFLRKTGAGVKGAGSRTLIVWPETSAEVASRMSLSFEERAGKSPVPIPAEIAGPSRESWVDIVKLTLRLVNSIDRLEEVGVEPDAYAADEYATIGDFMDHISNDFVELLEQLLEATRKPLQMVVAFASESNKPGILSELTSGYRYGLLDASKLVSATPGSEVGRWWGSRMGLLVQTIVRLDARVTHIPPPLSMAVTSRFGPEEAKKILREMEFSVKSPREVGTYFERSDFGRLLTGTSKSTAEGRGNPGADAVAAYSLFSQEYGLNGARDKALNGGLRDFLLTAGLEATGIESETKLPALPLLPDISIFKDSVIQCIELHWRTGDYLVSSNRASVAAYILRKLRSYATEMGWVSV